MRQHNK